MYRTVESLYGIPEINRTPYVNYTRIKKKKEGRKWYLKSLHSEVSAHRQSIWNICKGQSNMLIPRCMSGMSLDAGDIKVNKADNRDSWIL